MGMQAFFKATLDKNDIQVRLRRVGMTGSSAGTVFALRSEVLMLDTTFCLKRSAQNKAAPTAGPPLARTQTSARDLHTSKRAAGCASLL